MSGFFNYDNPVWRFIGKFGDVIILNILWLICSIPVFTIGASTTAVYYVTLKLVRDEDGYTIRSFFKSFKENFKQATIIWLIMLAAGVVIGFDLYFFIMIRTASSTFRTIMLAVFGGFGIIYLAISTYVYALQARFFNPVKKTLFNAFFMSIRHLFHTIGMLAVDGVIVFLMFTYVPQLILFGFPLIAFFNSYIFNAIFKKYIPEEQRDLHEMRPLFADEDEQAAEAAAAESESEKQE